MAAAEEATQKLRADMSAGANAGAGAVSSAKPKAAAPGPKATAPPDAPPKLVASALINITHPILTEDVVTRKTRNAMLSRNVEPALLVADSLHRQASASGGADSDARAQMLSALAPIIPVSRATHPILDPAFTGSDSIGVQAGAGGTSALSASIKAPKPVFTASGTMTQQLAATLSATGVQPVSEAQLAKMVLAKTGLRLKTTRSRPETFSRFGLDPFGRPLPQSAFDAGAGLGGRLGATSGGEPGPILPQVEDGKLGEWDKYRLRKIFLESDVDGSGELSREEIKGALSACADYGFCVQSQSSTGADLLGSSAALLGSSAAKSGGSAAKGAESQVLDAIFDAIDVDKSGTVTWREFIDVVETGVVADKKKEAKGKDGKPLASARGAGMTSPTRAPAQAQLPSASSAAERPTSPLGASRSRTAVKTPAEIAKERTAALLEQANTLLSSVRKKKAPEPIRVPQLRFRSLTPAEAALRADRYFKQAAEAWRAFQRITPEQHDRETQLVRLRAEMVAAGERGNRLALIAEALGGHLDPPERAPTPPRPRHDFAEFTSLVPQREEQRRGERGMRKYRVPYPGDETSLDEERLRDALNPSALSLSLEQEEGGEELQIKRLTAASAGLRTIGDPLWENYRLQQKAKKPHVVHRVSVHI